jgi:murein DD-endopeptidase MepM/ murein hydrolase activator NlpD
VDLDGSSGQEVLAVEAGTVTHVGSIAGRGTVTVLHSSGIRSTYEPVDPAVTTGSSLARDAPLGGLQGGGSHCAPATCLHLGALRGEAYLDPLVFLLGGQRVRLLPLGQSFAGQAGMGQAPDG